jgi:pimeloyl-ACP methyl ester carboxylesterase
MSASGSGLWFVERKIATGPTLRCGEIGAAEAGTILFLHGYGDSAFSAEPIVPFLPAGWRFVAPDQRGHGRSDRPAGGYEIETLAADAVAILDDLGCERAVVVGHSMGSLVAQRMAIDDPGRVARLVLVGSAAVANGPACRELAASVAAFGDAVPVGFIEAFQSGTAARPLPPEFFAGILAESARVPARVWRAMMRGILRFDARAELAAIAAPTRIVWGEEDAIFGHAEQLELWSGIRGATLSVYAGTGHDPHWEEPERFARELAEFVGARGAALRGSSSTTPGCAP